MYLSFTRIFLCFACLTGISSRARCLVKLRFLSREHIPLLLPIHDIISPSGHISISFPSAQVEYIFEWLENYRQIFRLKDLMIVIIFSNDLFMMWANLCMMCHLALGLEILNY